MTAKEKAIELFNQHLNYVSGWTTTNKPKETASCRYDGEGMKKGRAIQCAKITVEEVLNESKLHSKTIYQHGRSGFWNEVLHELNNL